MTDTDATSSSEQLWDAKYSESERIWSGNPNVALVREVAGLTPGTALDLGCGEGADSVWLAGQGWRVTGVDISRVALGRAAAHAAEAGVSGRIEWKQHDLAVSFPSGVFDLVSAQFLQSHGELPREEILRQAAAAVAPGGVLLIEGHSGFPAWEHGHHPHTQFPTPEQVLEDLQLPDGQWEVLVCAEHERSHTGPDGQPTTRTDSTVKVRRLAG